MATDLNEIKTLLKDLKTDVRQCNSQIDELHNVLGGDKFGNDGVVKELKITKKMAYQNKNKIDQAYWLAGILGTIAGLAASIAKNIFEK